MRRKRIEETKDSRNLLEKKTTFRFKKLKLFLKKNSSIIVSIITVFATLITTFLALQNYNTKLAKVRLSDWGIVDYEIADASSPFQLSSLTVQAIISNTGGSPVSIIDFAPEVSFQEETLETGPVTLGLDLRGGLQLLESVGTPGVHIGGDYFYISNWYPTPEVYLFPQSGSPTPSIEQVPIIIDPGESKIVVLVWSLNLPATRDFHITKLNIIVKFNDKTALTIPVLEAFTKP